MGGPLHGTTGTTEMRRYSTPVSYEEALENSAQWVDYQAMMINWAGDDPSVVLGALRDAINKKLENLQAKGAREKLLEDLLIETMINEGGRG